MFYCNICLALSLAIPPPESNFHPVFCALANASIAALPIPEWVENLLLLIDQISSSYMKHSSTTARVNHIPANVYCSVALRFAIAYYAPMLQELR